MQEFYYKQNEDLTWSAISYYGDEENVIIPDEYGGRAVTVLFDDLFRNHSEIRTVKLPSGLTDIGAFAFEGCSNLKKIEFPDTMNYFWQYSMKNCGIEEVILPESVISLAPFVFFRCKNLRKVVCHKGLKKIYTSVFKECENLEEIIVSADTEIHEDAFLGCPKVKVTTI